MPCPCSLSYGVLVLLVDRKKKIPYAKLNVLDVYGKRQGLNGDWWPMSVFKQKVVAVDFSNLRFTSTYWILRTWIHCLTTNDILHSVCGFHGALVSAHASPSSSFLKSIVKRRKAEEKEKATHLPHLLVPKTTPFTTWHYYCGSIRSLWAINVFFWGGAENYPKFTLLRAEGEHIHDNSKPKPGNHTTITKKVSLHCRFVLVSAIGRLRKRYGFAAI